MEHDGVHLSLPNYCQARVVLSAAFSPIYRQGRSYSIPSPLPRTEGTVVRDNARNDQPVAPRAVSLVSRRADLADPRIQSLAHLVSTGGSADNARLFP